MHSEWILADQNKKLEYGQYAIRKCYIQDDPQKKKYRFFFAEHPEYLKINEFYAYTLGE